MPNKSLKAVTLKKKTNLLGIFSMTYVIDNKNFYTDYRKISIL